MYIFSFPLQYNKKNTHLEGADVGQSFRELDDVVVTQVQGTQAAQRANWRRQLTETVTYYIHSNGEECNQQFFGLGMSSHLRSKQAVNQGNHTLQMECLQAL